MSQSWEEANPQMSNQWGEYMTLLATPGLPSCSNTDYLAGTSNPDFGAGTSNPDFGAENFIPDENDAENPIGDSLVNESDEASELDEAEYPIPPEDGPNHVDINVMAETFAQGRLDKGMLFKTKEELMEAVQDHSIRHARREYYVTESSKTKWKVLCKHSTEGHVKCNPSYGIKYVIQNVKDQTGYDVPYQKACNFKNVVLKDLCWQAGSEYQLRKFNRIMEEIKKQQVKAFAYLDQINKEKCTASHDGGWRCSILTTNMSEWINGVLKGDRRLPFRSAKFHLSYSLTAIFVRSVHLLYNSTPKMQYTNADSNPQLLPSISSLNPLQSPAQQFPSTLRHLHETIHVVMSNKKITSYIGCGDLNSAMEVFLNMKTRTTVTWNSILFGFSSKPGKLKEAKDLFDKIPEPDTVLYNVMLACNFKNASVEAAKDFFYRIPIKDIASWNIMISGFSQNGRMDDAKELFRVMPRRNIVTWNAMILGYVEVGNMESALNLFGKTPMKSVVAWTSIITGYMRCNEVELAEKAFHEMQEKNLVTWNVMIAGYVENGKQVHQYLYKSPIYFDTTVGTSLISMYCKRGVLEDGWKLFMGMSSKDVVTWNAMISGYA
ncbi:Pentatricopeptide repeat-containing protein, mitochondrial [Sesamum angolense]|uniref:Pentatricopeptide repeat-containing protein, mitochondrial n=1 Tax=Sesamum angolense TaxID=2727404 RepID=A0AAE2BWV9_9LAMI|nr:Pentatricopeptide repeat-containing protein, mitochondrial [Sesamum angolense]